MKEYRIGLKVLKMEIQERWWLSNVKVVRMNDYGDES